MGRLDWNFIFFVGLCKIPKKSHVALEFPPPPFFLFRSGFCRFLSFKTGRWVAGSFFFFTDDTVDG